MRSIVVVMLALLGSMQVPTTLAADVPEPRSLQFVSQEVATPHIAWAKPSARGTIKLLALISGGYQQREVVELAQRFDFEVTSSLYVAGPQLNVTWAIGDFRLHPDEMKRAYNAQLDRDKVYDVILLSANAWDALERDARRHLRELVEQGAGLVWIDPRPSSPDGWELLPIAPRTNKQAKQTTFSGAETHPLLTSLPLAILPAVGYGTYELKGEVELERTLTGGEKPALVLTSELGKARVVTLTYDARVAALGGTNVYEAGILPGRMISSKETPDYPVHEHLYALVGRAVQWAARRDPAVKLTGAVIPRNVTIDNIAQQKVTFNVESDKARAASLHVLIQDETGATEHEADLPIQIASGKSTVDIQLPALSAGTKVINVILADAAGKHDFRAMTLAVTAPVRITAVTTDKPAYLASETVHATVSLSAPAPAGTTLRLDLFDGVGRLLKRITPVVGSFDKPVDLPLDTAMGMRGKVRATLLISDRLIDQRETAYVLTPARTWDDFEITMWAGGTNDNTAHLHAAHMREFRRMGITSLVLNENETEPVFFNALLDAHMHICSRIGGYGKGGLLLPADSDATVPRYAEAAKFWATYGPFVNMAGDESFASVVERGRTAMTPDALAAYRKWLSEQYPSIGALNAQWQSQYTSWDQIMPFDAAELRPHTSNFSAFSDLKTFVEYCFAYRYQKIQEGISQGDPAARNSASGTQSAYYVGKGYDWWRLMTNGGFQALMGYNTGDQIRQQYSFARIPQVQWAGYGSQGKRLTQRMINRMWEGCHGVGMFAGRLFLNPDFSWNDGSRGLHASVPYICNGMAKLLMQSEYVFDPIAVHYSQPSIHGAYALGREADVERAAQGIGRDLIRAGGFESRYVASAQIEKGELQKYKLLIMPHSVALSVKEAQAIRQYVTDGGIVVADLLPGIMDDHARLLEKGLLDDVFGIQRTLPTQPVVAATLAEKARSVAPPKVEAAPEDPEAHIIADTKEGIAADVTKAVEAADAQPVPVGVPAKVFAPVLAVADQTDTAVHHARIVATGATIPDFNLSIPAGLPLTVSDPTVQATDAVVLAKEEASGAPLFLVRRLGKGMAILINSDVLARCGQPDRKLPVEEADAQRQLGWAIVRQILAKRELQAEAVLVNGQNEPIITQHQFLYRQGQNLYVRPEYLPAGSEPRFLKLARKHHVYQWPEGTYLGHLDRIPVRAVDADAADDFGPAYALLNYQVSKLEQPTESTVTRGTPLAMALTLITDTTPDLHVVHLEVLDPNDTPVLHYSQNIAISAGKATVAIPFSLNDVTGTWTVRVREVITGLSAETKVHVN